MEIDQDTPGFPFNPVIVHSLMSGPLTNDTSHVPNRFGLSLAGRFSLTYGGSKEIAEVIAAAADLSQQPHENFQKETMPVDVSTKWKPITNSSSAQHIVETNYFTNSDLNDAGDAELPDFVDDVKELLEETFMDLLENAKADQIEAFLARDGEMGSEGEHQSLIENTHSDVKEMITTDSPKHTTSNSRNHRPGTASSGESSKSGSKGSGISYKTRGDFQLAMKTKGTGAIQKRPQKNNKTKTPSAIPDSAAEAFLKKQLKRAAASVEEEDPLEEEVTALEELFSKAELREWVGGVTLTDKDWAFLGQPFEYPLLNVGPPNAKNENRKRGRDEFELIGTGEEGTWRVSMAPKERQFKKTRPWGRSLTDINMNDPSQDTGIFGPEFGFRIADNIRRDRPFTKGYEVEICFYFDWCIDLPPVEPMVNVREPRGFENFMVSGPAFHAVNDILAGRVIFNVCKQGDGVERSGIGSSSGKAARKNFVCRMEPYQRPRN